MQRNLMTAMRWPTLARRLKARFDIVDEDNVVVRANEIDISRAIRDEAVSVAASRVAALPRGACGLA